VGGEGRGDWREGKEEERESLRGEGRGGEDPLDLLPPEKFRSYATGNYPHKYTITHHNIQDACNF